jgi:hypothetical protein
MFSPNIEKYFVVNVEYHNMMIDELDVFSYHFTNQIKNRKISMIK